MTETTALTDASRAPGAASASAFMSNTAETGLALYALAVFIPLGLIATGNAAAYVLPLYLVSACIALLALGSGRGRIGSARFWLAAILGIVIGLALPALAWPGISLASLVSGRFGFAILCAAALGPVSAAVSHVISRNLLGLSTTGLAALLLHGLVLAPGFAVLALFPGLSGNTGPEPLALSLAGMLLTGAGAVMLLMHLALAAKSTGRSAALLTAALATAILLGGLAGFGTMPRLPMLLALLLIAILPFTPAHPAAAALALAANTALLPHIPALLAALPATPAPGDPALAVLLLPIAGIALAAMARMAASTRRRLAAGQTLETLHTAFARFGAGRLLRADLNAKRMHLPTVDGHTAADRSFADFFRGAHSSEMLELLEALQSPGPIAPETPFPVALSPDLFSSSSSDTRAAPPSPHRLHILEKSPGAAWIGMLDRTEQAALQAKIDRSENALAEALLREERLLSVASHELRTPMSVLSMLAEELDSGTPWSEIAPGFKSSSERINSVLDDLRVHDSREEVQLLQTVFTLREMAQHLQEVHTGPAQANGVALLFSLSQQSDTLIQSDYGRVFIALSKLIHNAIIHAHATEISVSVFLTRQSGGAAIATWQVGDNGRGIPPERRETIFRPFDTDGKGAGNARPGLGLYTARKAVQAMGGELSLRRSEADDLGVVPRRLPPFSTAKSKENYAGAEPSPGASFVLKHPVRLAKHTEYTTMEHLPVTESQATYPDKTVLLIEDNQIVGEITVARLRRLFGSTIWAERGDEALLAYEKNQPDLLLVDQLLPGMLGSDVVKHVRETDKTVPIIGITASTMGAECAELEGAGANYALEKPLSLQQMQKIAAEFFGPPETGEAPADTPARSDD